ncbi:MAG: RnfABCDGE type electron transport complex subunit G [Dysgonamonadaceae bacterium]|jgi:electron transport complex protein RnfG|nr:RnfABCDGE type electron transport complex subunit G [Dysgonamonadaceae bacterium]
MNKLTSSFRNLFLSLSAICIISGGILAAMNELTREPVAAAKKIKLENALQAVLPDFDNSPAEEAYWAPLPAGDSLKIYPAKKQGALVGAAVESHSMNGFSGEIKIIAGLDISGKLINYKVLEHSETPGLGSKMEEWFRTDKNRQNILGADLSQTTLKVTKDNGTVDAITGATISSRAFLAAVNRAYAAFSGVATDASSGATTDASSGATGDTKKGGEE